MRYKRPRCACTPRGRGADARGRCFAKRGAASCTLGRSSGKANAVRSLIPGHQDPEFRTALRAQLIVCNQGPNCVALPTSSMRSPSSTSSHPDYEKTPLQALLKAVFAVHSSGVGAVFGSPGDRLKRVSLRRSGILSFQRFRGWCVYGVLSGGLESERETSTSTAEARPR
jgi:hypothetical protein